MSGFWKEHKDVAQTGQRYKTQTYRQAHMSGSEKRSMKNIYILRNWRKAIAYRVKYM